jgi:hypothetical protein
VDERRHQRPDDHHPKCQPAFMSNHRDEECFQSL